MSSRIRTGALKQVKCRVCGVNLNLQSYKAHLVRLHKSENSNDLREFGQRTVFGVKRKLEETVTVEETVEYTVVWQFPYTPIVLGQGR